MSEEARPSIIDRLSGPLPRWLVYVLVPGFLGPVLILGFIFVSELAHDQDRCPYVRQSEQALSEAIMVREESRSCLPGLVERRFSVVRNGSERVLGRRRFSAAAFAPGHYRWRAELSAQGEVRIAVDNDGHEPAQFREGTVADETR